MGMTMTHDVIFKAQLMSFQDFTATVMALAVEFKFSVTSWGRSVLRNKIKSGADDSLHLSWLAVDVVMDNIAENKLLVKKARRLGLIAIDNKTYVHLQPGYPDTA